MTEISTHVLDTTTGRPVAGVTVELSRRTTDGDWTVVSQQTTDDDGRASGLAGPDGAAPGRHRLIFSTAVHLATHTPTPFFPEVVVSFVISGGEPHHHVPLLISPFGYTVYRGS